ncbi:MAG: hypothetical protein CISAcid_11290 [uncultured Acidilobus sp. CIS]|nr:MAG: hypothetical protein CISAcid_11290 [uncultured Acidilobus sp. CIS]
MAKAIKAAESALRAVAIGLLSSLNARFYARFGRPFVEQILVDPVAAYREALGVAPAGLVEATFKIVLRAFGLNPLEVEGAMEAVRAGDSRRFLEIVKSKVN